MMDIKLAVKNAKRWYEYGRSFVPDFPSKLFGRFAANSIEMAMSITGDGEPVTITVQNVPTAYVVPSTKSIVLPAYYFSIEFIKRRFGLGSEDRNSGLLAISAINGSTVHEALHILHTKCDNVSQMINSISLDAWRPDGTKDDSDKEYLVGLGKIAYAVVNVFEDLHIEANCPKMYKKWVDAKNMILFDSQELPKKIDGSMVSVVSILAAYKREDLRAMSVWDVIPPEAMYAMRAVASGNVLTVRERVLEAVKFLRALPQPEPHEVALYNDAHSGDGDMVGGSVSGSIELDELAAELALELGRKYPEVVSEFEEETLKKAMEASGIERTSNKFGTVYWKTPVMTTIDGYPYKGIIVHDSGSEIDFSFVRELAAIRTVNHVSGIARKSGSQMVNTRLARIATDGKVFAHRDSEARNERAVEVIILVDASGSTGTSVGSRSIYGHELGAAKEIARALRQARIPFTVAIHTSNSGEKRETPTIGVVESFNMKYRNIKGDDKWGVAERIELSENFDGVAIREASRAFFTDRPSQKFVIVLSDGAPQAPTYAGQAAAEHTRQVIAALRKTGTGIFSISVVRPVVEKNNKIYGREWNIDASTDIRRQFRNLIKKIGGG